MKWLSKKFRSLTTGLSNKFKNLKIGLSNKSRNLKIGLSNKFKNLKTMDKISTIFWIIWIFTIILFVIVVVTMSYLPSTLKSFKANMMAGSGLIVIVMLFTSLALTVFPRVKWGKK